jgi:hypothetical protein
MVCIVFFLDLPELDAQELERYLSSIENDQPIYSLTGLNAQEIAEEVDLFFKNDQGERMVAVYFQLLVQSYGYNATVSRVTIQRICRARVSTLLPLLGNCRPCFVNFHSW